MKAMILAAGEGKRMLPLTQTTPKPLLCIDGVSLIERLLNQLEQANIHEVIINVRYLADKFHEMKENRKKTWPKIIISDETSHSHPLDTGGGIIAARPFLGEEPFLVISGDLYTQFPFSSLDLPSHCDGHLVLIENPPFNPKGDFNLDAQGLVSLSQQQPYTYGNIALFSPNLFNLPLQSLGLGSLMRKWATEKRLSGEVYHGLWDNVGTPEQLQSHQSVKTCT